MLPRNPSDPSGAELRRAGLRRVPAVRDALGRGLLGETWASTGQDGGPLAVKRIRVSQLRERSASQLASIQRLPRLRHPALVPVVDVVFGDDAVWIVSDFDRGVTLRRLLTMTILNPTEAAMIVRRILEGLDALEDWGLEHGDLHANNVHVSPEGEVRLGDWGLRPLASPTRVEGRLDASGGSDLSGAAILIRRIMSNSRRWLGRRSPGAVALDEAAAALPVDGDDDRLRPAMSKVRQAAGGLLDRDAAQRAQFDIASRVRAVAPRPGLQPGPATPGGQDTFPATPPSVRPPPSATIVRPAADPRAGWSRAEPDLPRRPQEGVQRRQTRPERGPEPEWRPPAPEPEAKAAGQPVPPPAPPPTEPSDEPAEKPTETSEPAPEAAPDTDREPGGANQRSWAAGAWEIREWPAPPAAPPAEATKADEAHEAEADVWGATPKEAPDQEARAPEYSALEEAEGEDAAADAGQATAEAPRRPEPAESQRRPADRRPPLEEADQAKETQPDGPPTPALPLEGGGRQPEAEEDEPGETVVPSSEGADESAEPAGPAPRRGAGGLFLVLVGLLVVAAVIAGIAHLRAGQQAGQGPGAPAASQTAAPPAARPTPHAPAPVPASLPSSAGNIRAIQLRPVTPTCAAGSTCTVRVDLQLVPMASPQRLTWSFKVIDRCTGAVTDVPGVDFETGPGWASAYGTTDVPLPAGQALALVAVTSSPSQTASAPLLIPAQASSCQS